MPIFNQTLGNELLHTGKLSRKHRGELAELAFMRKAAAFGFGVAKPWGDCDRYDVILRADKVFWRVQVKSVWSTEPTRKHYRIKTSGNLHIPYTAEQIDFLVAYVFPKDAWYVFPVALVENRESVCVSPGRAKSRLEPYRGTDVARCTRTGHHPKHHSAVELRATLGRKNGSRECRATRVLCDLFRQRYEQTLFCRTQNLSS